MSTTKTVTIQDAVELYRPYSEQTSIKDASRPVLNRINKLFGPLSAEDTTIKEIWERLQRASDSWPYQRTTLEMMKRVLNYAKTPRAGWRQFPVPEAIITCHPLEGIKVNVESLTVASKLDAATLKLVGKLSR